MGENKIALIGAGKRIERIYRYIEISKLEIKSVVIICRDEIESVMPVPIYALDDCSVDLSEYDICFVCSEDQEYYRNWICSRGRAKVIKADYEICHYLSKKDIMEFYKEEMALLYHVKMVEYNKLDERGFCELEVGDYTYGIPKILDWGIKCRLKIGKFCSIAYGVTIMAGGGNHHTEWISTYPFNALMHNCFLCGKNEAKTNGNVVIGNDVWIGSDVKIMSGVTIGDGSVIAANAVVTNDVSPYSIVGGVPSKLIRKRFCDEVIEKLLKIQWWNWEKEKIYDAIPLLQCEDIHGLLEYYNSEVINTAGG